MVGEGRSKRALLAVMATALLAACVALLLLRRPELPPPVAPVLDEAPRPPQGSSRVPAPTQTSAPGYDDPALANLAVRWCADLDAPRELTRYDFGAQKVHPVDLPDECSRRNDGACVYTDLDPGVYEAHQGPFSASVFLGWNDRALDVEMDLGCVSGCGAQVTVQVEEACAEAGRLQIRAQTRQEDRPPDVDVAWRVGEAFVLEGLPCRSEAFVRLDAEGCASEFFTQPVDEVRGTWQFTLKSAGKHWVRALDDTTGEPIQGARVRAPGLLFEERSDAEGWMGPMNLDGRNPAVLAPGYADLYISAFKIDEQTEITVRMLPTHPVEVRCDDGGEPCPHGTWIWTGSRQMWRSSGRQCCRLTGEWSCTCWVAEGDKVSAFHEGRSSPGVLATGDGPFEVFMPLSEGEVCLSWSAEHTGPCKLSAMELAAFSLDETSDTSENTAVPYRPITLAREPGTDVMAVLACADASWSGVLTVHPPGSSDCERVPLVPHGSICGGGGPCTAYSQRPLQTHVDFNGCTPPVPAWDWWVHCGEKRWTTEVQPGATAELGEPE